ncbi:YqiA/YcfP family alpha/beta fold hydrolase [Undibacterium cyanobacteriorum]|uniref:YqiA/YcfP family alpha/beta fold hydrolase n=1 Tax=Undibacterium cyanobacteriorum TaxID=3073561 RepID=A0ABY9RGR3_9BURK|nr:YqiA/YcfP family alpha/beta fold hydrolase [Undibacterium sp. 20NA77.5]WMW79465.1 YqiA/YcfP family alpha/beta fold hydrolase [Undibacterium sp. 20NA77.5]
MILYLHGFRSSPLSFKARLLTDYFREQGRSHEFVCPALPASPAAAIALARSIVQQHPEQEWSLIGSSLGGCYATFLAEELNCKAVLLNPAVKPPRELASYVGITTNYHTGEEFEFKAAYVDELKALAVDKITKPERYFLMAATGDEVLDWREMVAHYAGAQQFVIEGSDHGISEFADYLQMVVDFCDA